MSGRTSTGVEVGAGIVCDKSTHNVTKSYNGNREENKGESQDQGEKINLCYMTESSLNRLEHKPVVTREVYDTTMGVGMPAAAVGGGGIGVVAPLIFRGIKAMFVK